MDTCCAVVVTAACAPRGIISKLEWRLIAICTHHFYPSHSEPVWFGGWFTVPRITIINNPAYTKTVTGIAGSSIVHGSLTSFHR